MSNAVAPGRALQWSSSNVVKPTIFMLGSRLRKTDAASTPFIVGMLRSRITSAGARALAFSMAASPSSASQQALKGVALSMKWQMASRTAALSSTTRIHGVRREGIEDETTRVSRSRQYEFVVFFVYRTFATERYKAGKPGHTAIVSRLLLRPVETAALIRSCRAILHPASNCS